MRKIKKERMERYMAKNLRALTDEELKYINEKYTFEVFKDEYIIVKCQTRKTLHAIGKSFALSTPIRKVAISTTAIDMWLQLFVDKYSLIDVQNAISTLTITYQPINRETVENQIIRKTTEIKKV